MSEAVGPMVGDLPQLGELLALLHRADAAFDSVEATYRIWRPEERSSAGWRALRAELAGRPVQQLRVADDSDRPVGDERVLRIWRAEDRVRVEHECGLRNGATWSVMATPGGRGTSATARTAIKVT